MPLPPEQSEWFENLRAFVERIRGDRDLPEADELDALQNQQRRISGGVLHQFFNFIQDPSSFDIFPILDEHSVADRAFVFATDLPGAVAGRDFIDPESDRAIVVLKDEWQAWLNDPKTDSDDTFENHFQCWNAWHQNLKATWEIPEEKPGEFWVHEEGFAVAERAGRGSQHLWRWDGNTMELEEEEIDSWVSRPSSEED